MMFTSRPTVWKWEPGPTQLRRQAVAARSAELLTKAVVIDVETTGIGGDAEVIEIDLAQSQWTPR